MNRLKTRLRWQLIFTALVPLGLYLALLERISWRPRLFYHTPGSTQCHIEALAWSRNGELLAFDRSIEVQMNTTSRWEGQIQLWNVQHETLRQTINLQDEDFESIHLPPQAAVVVAGFRHQYNIDSEDIIPPRSKVWKSQDGQLLSTLRGGRPFGMTDSELHTLDNRWGQEGLDVITYALPSGKVLRRVHLPFPVTRKGHPDWPPGSYMGPAMYQTTLAPDARRGAVVVAQERPGLGRYESILDKIAVKVFDARAGRFTRTLPVLQSSQGTEGLGAMVFSPDGRHLAIVVDQTIQVWDVNTGRRQHVLWPRERFRIDDTPLVFSPDGQTLAFGVLGYINPKPGQGVGVQLWDVNTGQLQRTLRGSLETDVILSLAFAPTGRDLAVGAQDGQVILWRIQ